MAESEEFIGTERRQVERPKVRLRARYRLFDESQHTATDPVEAEAVDLSLMGLMLKTDEIETEGVALLPRLGSDQGPRVDVELDLGADGDAINVTGRVIWLRLAEQECDHKYAAGVVFSYMGEPAQEALRSYLDSR